MNSMKRQVLVEALFWHIRAETVALAGIKPNVAIHFSLVLDANSKLVFGWLGLDGHLTVVSVQTVAVSVVATVGTVSKTMVAKAVVSVVGISSSLSLRGSS